MTQPVAHIITDREITLTYCDRMLAGVPDVDDLGPQAMSYGSDVAYWDNSERRGEPQCRTCLRTYMEAHG